MGVFEGSGPQGYELGPTKAVEPCKPEWEKMIVTAKKKQEKTKTFLSALQNYLLPDMRYERKRSFTLDELVGALTLEDLEFDVAIERLIDQQEQEAKRK